MIARPNCLVGMASPPPAGTKQRMPKPGPFRTYQTAKGFALDITFVLSSLPRPLGGREDQLIRRRQVEPRFKPEQGRNPSDDLRGNRRGVPARRGKTVGLGDRLRLAQHEP